MVKLRRIGVGSAGRFGFLLGAMMMIAQVIVALFMLFVQAGIPPTALPPEIWQQIGFMILLSGGLTGLGVFLFSFIYNISNGMFGSLELEFEMPDSPEEKRKNGEVEIELED